MTDIDYDNLGEALARAGSSWNAAQAHGLITGKLSVAGPESLGDALTQILEGSDEHSALHRETAGMIAHVFEQTRRELGERLSAFIPMLPDDAESRELRAAALGFWCEGYLHGLVSNAESSANRLRERLAEDPVADIIKDMLQITRASAEPGDDAETHEDAYTELVEYLRVAAQLVYEELAEARHGSNE